MTEATLLNCVLASALHFKRALPSTLESHREAMHSSWQQVSLLISYCGRKWDEREKGINRVRSWISDTYMKRHGTGQDQLALFRPRWGTTWPKQQQTASLESWMFSVLKCKLVECILFLNKKTRKRQQLNTSTNTLGHLPFSVMITSVWELPYLWIWSTASCMLSTTSKQHSRSPYSVRRDFASDGLNVRKEANRGPAWIFT